MARRDVRVAGAAGHAAEVQTRTIVNVRNSLFIEKIRETRAG
jgi:hypothetical protein